MNRWFCHVVVLVGLLLSVAGQVRAQSLGEEETGAAGAAYEATGIHYSLLPVFGFTSDLGFFGGGVLQRINYENGERPFHTNTAVHLIASSMGNLDTKIEYEHLNSFGGHIRSSIRIEGLRLLRNTYFGIGNKTEFKRDEFDDGHFFFEERSVKLQYLGRRYLAPLGRDGRIDGQFLATVSYSDPRSTGAETVFNRRQPPGVEGGWMNQAGIGVVLENRDYEIGPTRGYRLEVNGMASHRWLGSEFQFSGLFAEARGYFSPFGDPLAGARGFLLPLRDLVVAQKLEVQHVSGDVPFWELPAVGNELGLRGYALNRFRGESSVLHIVELRTWLIRLLDGQIRLGGQLFMDTGRVFANEDRLGDLPDDLKQTFGFGGAISIGNPDFVFRGDIAFSEDLFRIYFGLGYLF